MATSQASSNSVPAAESKSFPGPVQKYRLSCPTILTSMIRTLGFPSSFTVAKNILPLPKDIQTVLCIPSFPLILRSYQACRATKEIVGRSTQRQRCHSKYRIYTFMGFPQRYRQHGFPLNPHNAKGSNRESNCPIRSVSLSIQKNVFMNCFTSALFSIYRSRISAQAWLSLDA